jgi:hypothetical protein
MIQLVDHDGTEMVTDQTDHNNNTESGNGGMIMNDTYVSSNSHDDPYGGDDSDMNYLPHERLRGSEQSDIDSSDIDTPIS